MTDLAVRQATSLSAYMHSEGAIKRFDEVLGNGNSGGYIASVMIAVAQNQKLMECRQDSILGSALRAATMRLSVDPSVGHAYLVPFKGQCTLIVGYKGIYQMALRTNKYRFLELTPVFKDDKLVEDRKTGLIEFDLGDGFTATPMRRRVKYDLNEVQGYILYFKLTSGFEKTFYMTVEEIEEHGAKFSKTYNFGDSPWKTNKRAMYEKTVIRLGILKWGYLDPSDIQSINQSEYVENEVVEGEVTDEVIKKNAADYDRILAEEEEWEREDDETTAEKAMDELGYENPAHSEPVKAKTIQEQPKPETGMSLEMAETERNTQNVLYKDIDTEKLSHMLNAMLKIKSNTPASFTDDHARKCDAIKTILAARQSA